MTRASCWNVGKTRSSYILQVGLERTFSISSKDTAAEKYLCIFADTLQSLSTYYLDMVINSAQTTFSAYAMYHIMQLKMKLKWGRLVCQLSTTADIPCSIGSNVHATMLCNWAYSHNHTHRVDRMQTTTSCSLGTWEERNISYSMSAI